MTENTRILHRFTGYTVADCDCEYCLHYGGKRTSCTAESCCCTEERLQAINRQRKDGLYGSKNQQRNP